MTTLTQSQISEKMWDAIEDKHVGMLGITGSHDHMQPMSAYAEQDTKSLWFYTYNDTQLARAIAKGETDGMFCFEGENRDLHACIAGKMRLMHDTARIEKYWNMMASAWFPEGKKDPRLTMICFEVTDAHVWYTDKTKAGFMFEIIKANITDTTPNVGGHARIRA